MMIALPRQITCQKIMAAAREQAWTSPQQVLGLPTRLGGEPQYTRHWDLTAIAEVLDQATALQWGPDELTAWNHDGSPHHFAIMRPGADADQVSDYVVTDDEFDQIFDQLQRHAFASGVLIAGTHRRGKSATWTMTCPAANPDCARPPAGALDRAEAEALASDHDGLHHGGSMTAEVAPTPEMTR